MAKKALLVGINRYSNPGVSLRGCLNDVNSMVGVLTASFGFSPSDMKMLVNENATKANIVANLHWLVENAAPGDVLVFHYSGHGSLIALRDEKGQIVDARQPVICTYELNWSDPLTFKEVGQILVAPEGVNITSILDCCHSGHDFRDLKPRYYPGMSLSKSEIQDLKMRFLPPPPEIMSQISPKAKDVIPQPRKTSDDTDILMTGCGLLQTSADAYIKGAYRGAFTYCLSQALMQTQYKADYINVLTQTIQVLRQCGFNQTPQLEGAVNKIARWAFLSNPAAAVKG